jgi:hypothetical protein
MCGTGLDIGRRVLRDLLKTRYLLLFSSLAVPLSNARNTHAFLTGTCPGDHVQFHLTGEQREPGISKRIFAEFVEAPTKPATKEKGRG